MSYWKSISNSNLRVYFKVTDKGFLVEGLTSDLFDTLLINPLDSASSATIVNESSQRPGIYYTDLDSVFLVNNGIGMYGLSISLHKPEPNRLDDEALFPIEVSQNDINFLSTKIDDLHKIHGLNENHPVTVGKTLRDVADINQTFTQDGNNIIVTRNV